MRSRDPLSLTVIMILFLAVGVLHAAESDSIPAEGGDLRITPILHA